MPCVLVNPRVPVATKDVFDALGLRNGELLVGATDVLRGTAWPEAGASVEDWVEVSCGQFQRSGGARHPHPAGDRRRALGAPRHQRRLAGADVGLGRDLFCDL